MSRNYLRIRRLFWRGVVAGATNVAMTSGLYPFGPTFLVREIGRRRGRIGTEELANTNLPWLMALEEWQAALAATVTRPLGFVGERLAKGTGRPIVLVHGYAMNRSSFMPLALRLKAAGLGPVYGFEYWSLGKVASAARRLSEFVESLCERHGADKVDIIGHSMGGLVSRYYLCLGPRQKLERVGHLVTIGTPHGGSIFSPFGFGRASAELGLRAPFLQRMAAARVPNDTRALAIWSRGDVLAGTPAQARWEGVREIVLEDRGHIAMLFSKRVASLVISELKT